MNLKKITVDVQFDSPRCNYREYEIIARCNNRKGKSNNPINSIGLGFLISSCLNIVHKC
jgi:hypothetical protein